MTIRNHVETLSSLKLIIDSSLAIPARDLDRPLEDGAMCFPIEDCLDYDIRLAVPYEYDITDQKTMRALFVLNIPDSDIYKLIAKYCHRSEELSLKSVLAQMPNSSFSDEFIKLGGDLLLMKYPTIVEDLYKLSSLKKNLNRLNRKEVENDDQ